MKMIQIQRLDWWINNLKLHFDELEYVYDFSLCH